MRKLIYITVIVFAFISCEKEVDIPIEYSESKLVVNSVFCTDSLWNVEISASKYIYDTMQIPLLDNAIVTIADSDKNSIELFNQGNGIYTSLTEKPELNKAYTVNVLHSVYDNVSSTSKLPNNININDISWDEQVLFEGQEYRKVKITFQDPPENNYYSIRVFERNWMIEGWNNEGYLDSILVEQPYYIISQNASVSNNENKNYVTSIYFSDDLFDGNEYTFDFLLDNYMFENSWGSGSERLPIYISFSTLSKDLYWYQTSLQKYQYSNGDFFSQPVQVYTNVENGLGIFAGCSSVQDSIVVE